MSTVTPLQQQKLLPDAAPKKGALTQPHNAQRRARSATDNRAVVNKPRSDAAEIAANKKAVASGYHGLAKDTAILTDQGYRNYEELKKMCDESLPFRVMTFNSETEAFEYETPTGLFEKTGCHDLYKITKNGFSICATVNQPIVHIVQSTAQFPLANDGTGIKQHSLFDTINNNNKIYVSPSGHVFNVKSKYFFHRVVNHAENGRASPSGTWLPQELAMEKLVPKKWNLVYLNATIGPIPIQEYEKLLHDLLWIVGFWLGDGSLQVGHPDSDNDKYYVYVIFCPHKDCDTDMLREKLTALGLTEGVDFTAISNRDKLDAELKNPDAELKNPDAELKNPDAELKNPDAELKNPDAELKNPDAELKNPDAELKNPDSKANDKKKKKTNDTKNPVSEDVKKKPNLTTFRIFNKEWVHFYAKNFGFKYSVDRRSVAKIPRNATINDFEKGDQLERFILHAGLTGHSALQSEAGSKCTLKSGKTIKKNFDCWRVNYSLPYGVSLATFKNDDVTLVKSNEDGVWGVRTPSGTLIVRGAPGSQGIVVASKN